jgi:hypothetical protein
MVKKIEVFLISAILFSPVNGSAATERAGLNIPAVLNIKEPPAYPSVQLDFIKRLQLFNFKNSSSVTISAQIEEISRSHREVSKCL